MLPIAWDGPIIAAENSTSGPEWSCCFSEMLLVSLHEPNVAAKKKIPPMSMNGLTATPEMLLKHLHGPIIAAERIC